MTGLCAKTIRIVVTAMLIAGASSIMFPTGRARAAVSPAWETVTPPAVTAFSGVSVLDERHVWAVDTTGSVWFFDGSTWAAQPGAPATALRGVSAAAEDDAWAVGDMLGGGPAVYHFNGSTWASLTTGNVPGQAYNGVFALDADHAWAAGGGGTCISWNGTQWSQESFAPPPGPIGNMYGVYALDADNVWIVGSAGQIFHYVTGLGWTQEVSGTTADLYSVYAVDSNNVFAVGSGGTVLRYQGSWQSSSITPSDLHSVSGVDATHVWACGQSGEIWRFNGTTWAQETSGAVQDLKSVCAVDQVRAWAVGDQGTILSRGYPAPTVASITPSSGANNVTVNVTNLAGTNLRAGATVKLRRSGQADITATAVAVVSETKIICSLNLSGKAAGAWYVVITNSDGRSATAAGAFTITAAPAVQDTWYLAEGSTAWGFDTYISVVNPNSTAVNCDITYMIAGAANQVSTVRMEANSRATIFPGDQLGEKDFSTKIVCREGKTICADRTMMWTGTGSTRPEAHSSVGVNAPANRWYLPEGSSAWGFECWLLVQNPNPQPATITLMYMTEGDGPVYVDKEVPANSRGSFSMGDDLGQKDASIMVTSNRPVIPERAMYRYDRREGHDSIGTTAAADSFYLAEGTTAWGFTTFILVQNPSNSANTVTVTYMTPEGPVTQPQITVESNSRKTIRVNDTLINKDFSTRVDGSQPLIAERAMYWTTGAGEACHDSIGMSAPHTTFYLPDGGAYPDVETWTLVQNPNDTAVSVEVKYLRASGDAVSFIETIPANSRKTYNMGETGIADGDAGIVVTSKTAGKKIMCERAMYFYGRSAGTDTIGGYSD
jgi:hypothetical protein